VLIGRAYAYGMAAAGPAGVERALEILRADMERTLRLLGCASVSALDASYVDVPLGLEPGAPPLAVSVSSQGSVLPSTSLLGDIFERAPLTAAPLRTGRCRREFHR
jgi:hypothetical protein